MIKLNPTILKRKVLASAVALVWVCAAHAQLNTAAIVASKFKAKYPATQVDSVKESKVNGIYEIVMGEQIAYTDASGRYFIFGHMFDMETQTDLTEEARPKAVRKPVEFPVKDLKNAIKVVKGNGRREIAVFSDPKCPYCTQLEKELDKLNDVTIYTFLYPVLGEESTVLATSVWCSPAKAGAWSGLMLDNKRPVLKACEAPIQANLALGKSMGITGTPSMIARDGKIYPGAASAAQIETWLGSKQ